MNRRFQAKFAKLKKMHILKTTVHSVLLVQSSNPRHGPVRSIRLRKSNYLKIILMHMMIRKIIPGRQQTIR